MFGRSKLATKRCACSSFSSLTISSRVRSSAVAVSAMRGTFGKRSASTFSWRYSGRKSCPHCETQCASSMANSDSSVRVSSDRVRSCSKPLGRNVEDVEATGGDAVLQRRLLAIVERRVEKGGLDAGLRQRLDLILHERDQRRDDDAGAGAHERGDLVAQRLAAAGRHQRQRVAAGDHRRDDVRLVRAEVAEAEYVGQNLPRTIEGAGGIHDLARCGARHFPRTLCCPTPRLGSAIRG